MSITTILNFTKEDFPDADVVLRTGDGTLLYAHRIILQIASPFFKGKSKRQDGFIKLINLIICITDMFTLPQPAADSSKSHMSVDAPPIINVQEDAETMRQLLTPIYPCLPYICIQNMTLARQVHLLATARKYLCEAIVMKIADNLPERAQRNPSEAFTIFAVGCVLRLDEVVRAASASCLKLPASQLKVPTPQGLTENSFSNSPESTPLSAERRGLQAVLAQFSYGKYQQLLQFYWQRVAAIKHSAGSFEIELSSHESRFFDTSHCQNKPKNRCIYQITDSIRDFLKNGVDSYGPDLELLLDGKFLFDRHGDMASLCGPCIKAVTNGPYRADIEKFVKEQMKLLPSFEITA
jgi:hypothetical protein